ncbi:MAG: hypothetical protein AAFX40_14430, partial [Cyanobacteria bacterium J06639_1]
LDWLESETPWDESTMMTRLRSHLKRAGRAKFTRQVVAKTLKLLKTEGTRQTTPAAKRTSKRRKPRAVRALPDRTAVPFAIAARSQVAQAHPASATRTGDRAS